MDILRVILSNYKAVECSCSGSVMGEVLPLDWKDRNSRDCLCDPRWLWPCSLLDALRNFYKYDSCSDAQS